MMKRSHGAISQNPMPTASMTEAGTEAGTMAMTIAILKSVKVTITLISKQLIK